MSLSQMWFTPNPTPGAILGCAVLLAGLSLSTARSNDSYLSTLVYQPPGNNTSATIGSDSNEVSLGEEIVLSFLRRFIGTDKLKKSEKSSFIENLRHFVKSVEDLLTQEPRTYSVVREVPISKPEMGETEMEKADVAEGRGKMTDMMFSPYMLIPQLIMLGFSPIVLANLKMFVMQTFMVNQMAFSAALWMTIRNMVFGPSPEPPVKYYNFGYEKPHPHHPHHNHRRRNAPAPPGRRRIDK